MRKRNATITIRCTEQERDRIKARAESYNLKLSDFVLRSALGKKIVVAEGLDEVIRQMKAIGNNINQLARAVNEGRLNAFGFQEVQTALFSIYDLLGQIIKEVR